MGVAISPKSEMAAHPRADGRSQIPGKPEVMDAATTLLALGPALVALALVDSLSIGTLAVPVWLMLAPGRPRPQRILLYLGVLGGFYFLVGLVLLGGANLVLANVEIDWNSPVAMTVLFLVGAALLGASFIVDPPGKSKPGRGGQRLARWRAAATGSDATGSDGAGDSAAPRSQSVPTGPGGATVDAPRRARTGSLVGLAVTVGVIEVGTMLPYLAAIGLMTGSDQAFPGKVLMLAGYCLVMLLPALLLLVGRQVAARLLDPLLGRLDRWFAKHGGEALGWILGIVGVVLMGRNLSAVMELLNGV